MLFRAPNPQGLEFPMSVDQQTVKRVARLARLKVKDEEVPHLQGELNAMLAFVEQLSRWTWRASSR
jgi:hypothetical protein